MEITSENKTKTNKNRRYTGIIMDAPLDFTVLFIVLFLVVFGIIMVYSSSFYIPVNNQEINPYIKQGIFALIGFVVMYSISRVNLSVINYFAPLLYLITIALLTIVLFIDNDVKGASRWIPLGGFNLQPSEITKFTLIVILSLLLTTFHKHLTNRKATVVFFLFAIIPIALVLKEDLSTGIILIGIVLCMLFAVYKNIIRVVVIGIFLGVAGAGFFWADAYRRERIKMFLSGPWTDPEGKGRQIIQSLYAIGSGGLTGIGLGQSMQKMGYISEAHNDIIFAIICEELGLLGGISIIGIYILLLYKIAQVSIASKSMNHFLIGIGVMSHIGMQVFINIGVATSLLPTTGMPLPFISYGGSSLIMLMAEIGLILNISRHNQIENVLGGL
jgi:cell division protein FtsW